jgi:hypothetical protein
MIEGSGTLVNGYQLKIVHSRYIGTVPYLGITSEYGYQVISCLNRGTLVLRIRDPVPFVPLDPGYGMGKKKTGSDPGSEFGTNNLDHISESLETIFWVKILKILCSGSGMEKIRIRDKHPGSATLVLRLQKM